MINHYPSAEYDEWTARANTTFEILKEVQTEINRLCRVRKHFRTVLDFEEMHIQPKIFPQFK